MSMGLVLPRRSVVFLMVIKLKLIKRSSPCLDTDKCMQTTERDSIHWLAIVVIHYASGL